jgi:hypothetical protein
VLFQGPLFETVFLGAERKQAGSGDGGEKFGEAEDAAIVAGFALDVVYAGPVGLRFFGWGCNAGDGDFDFDAIVEAEEVDLAGRSAIVVKAEAEFAG